MWQCHCQNRGKKNFVTVVALALPKMGGKKCGSEIWGGVKKKKCYVYNIFTINHMWLVIVSSNLNLTLKLHF